MKDYLLSAIFKTGSHPIGHRTKSETHRGTATARLNKAVAYCNHYKAYVTSLVSAQKRAKTRRDTVQGVLGPARRKARPM